MKILFLTNFYPPASRGGYEQWCQEVGDGLRERGHEVTVLTSTYGRKDVHNDPVWVKRELHLEMELASLKNALQFFTVRKNRERENLRLLQKTIDHFSPAVILLWGMWNFPRSLPVLAEKLLPGRVAYYMGDYWPTLPGQFENYWNAPSSYLAAQARLFRSLDPGHHFFAHVLGRLLVSIEVHRIGGTALRTRAQIRRITEHLR